MGTNCAVQLANIFGFELETTVLSKAPHGSILYHFRYVDDVFLAVQSNEIAAWVLTQFNAVTPQIVYSGEVSGKVVPYLDLCIKTGTDFRRTGILDTSTYCKPSSSKKTYPLLSSYHYPPTFRGWIKAELFRLIRNCSSELNLLKDKITFVSNLLRRGLDPPWLASLFRENDFTTRDTLLANYKFKSKNKVLAKRSSVPYFFKSTYTAATKNLDFLQIYKKEMSLLPSYLHRRIIAVYKKSKNLRDILIKNSKI